MGEGLKGEGRVERSLCASEGQKARSQVSADAPSVRFTSQCQCVRGAVQYTLPLQAVSPKRSAKAFNCGSFIEVQN